MKNLKVAKWIDAGNISERAKTQKEILNECGDLLDGCESHEILGGPILFKATNGRHYTVTVEAVISEASKGFVKDRLDEKEMEKQEQEAQ